MLKLTNYIVLNNFPKNIETPRMLKIASLLEFTNIESTSHSINEHKCSTKTGMNSRNYVGSGTLSLIIIMSEGANGKKWGCICWGRSISLWRALLLRYWGWSARYETSNVSCRIITICWIRRQCLGWFDVWYFLWGSQFPGFK